MNTDVIRLAPWIGDLSPAFQTGDKTVVAGYIRAEFGVDLRPSQLAEIMRRGRDLNSTGRCVGCSIWSDASWRLWIKNRLCEFGCFQTTHCAPQDFDHWISATMHIFFIHLEESPMMLRLLRRAEPGEPRKPVARSKVFQDDSRRPVPIDGTASRVAPDVPT